MKVYIAALQVSAYEFSNTSQQNKGVSQQSSIFHTQIEVFHSFAMEKERESNDTYNKREMEVMA